MRRDLQADEAVGAAGGLVDRPQDVGRHADLVHREALVELRRRQLGIHRQEARHLRVVEVGVADRFLEDGRVAGHAGQAVVDKALELTSGEQIAADEIEPEGLALGPQLVQGVHGSLRRSQGRVGCR